MRESNASVKMATVQQTTRLWFYESKSIVTVQRRFRLEYRNCRFQVRTPSSVGVSNLREQERCRMTTVSEEVVERVRETCTPSLLIRTLNPLYPELIYHQICDSIFEPFDKFWSRIVPG
ncbi:hypothetical protein AVEN_43509-1 [Araneus ventricosus]|uniref:DUF4817 domain-containing protein n=1 Tax=Araneus ventricosus TaxID=182803 RepID=A0A4Y2F5H8_ARAVE|nr:hypothetical protein AVEN_43509-1 [Araneus ventricosus]